MEIGQQVKVNVIGWKLWYTREYGRAPVVSPDSTTVYTVQKTHLDHRSEQRANIIDPATNLTFWSPVKLLKTV